MQTSCMREAGTPQNKVVRGAVVTHLAHKRSDGTACRPTSRVSSHSSPWLSSSSDSEACRASTYRPASSNSASRSSSRSSCCMSHRASAALPCALYAAACAARAWSRSTASKPHDAARRVSAGHVATPLRATPASSLLRCCAVCPAGSCRTNTNFAIQLPPFLLRRFCARVDAVRSMQTCECSHVASTLRSGCKNDAAACRCASLSRPHLITACAEPCSEEPGEGQRDRQRHGGRA